jgi:FMN phosphatase YigB (HAD superfamily)
MEDLREWKISEKTFWEIISKKTNTEPHPNNKTIFSTPPHVYASLNKSIIRLIIKLKKLWYKSVLLSDEFKPQGESIKKLWRYDSFDFTILSCDIWLSKYNDVKNGTTKVFDYIIKKYKLKPQEAIFIDDRKVNCMVAEKTWIKSILAEKPTQVIRDIKKILKI